MKCPECKSYRNIVIDTRKLKTNHTSKGHGLIIDKLLKENNIILRLRECLNKDCRNRFWTQEEVIIGLEEL